VLGRWVAVGRRLCWRLIVVNATPRESEFFFLTYPCFLHSAFFISHLSLTSVNTCQHKTTTRSLPGRRPTSPPDIRTTQFDRSGRSTGVVSVEYETHQQARAAINSFDGQLAKGQPLSIRFDDARPVKRAAPELLARISGVSMPKPQQPPRSTPNRGSAPRGTGRGGASRGGGRGASSSGGAAGGHGGRRPQKTAEDLDKELEAFVSGGTAKPAKTSKSTANVAQPTGLGNDDVEMS